MRRGGRVRSAWIRSIAARWLTTAPSDRCSLAVERSATALPKPSPPRTCIGGHPPSSTQCDVRLPSRGIGRGSHALRLPRPTCPTRSPHDAARTRALPHQLARTVPAWTSPAIHVTYAVRDEAVAQPDRGVAHAIDVDHARSGRRASGRRKHLGQPPAGPADVRVALYGRWRSRRLGAAARRAVARSQSSRGGCRRAMHAAVAGEAARHRCIRTSASCVRLAASCSPCQQPRASTGQNAPVPGDGSCARPGEHGCVDGGDRARARRSRWRWRRHVDAHRAPSAAAHEPAPEAECRSAVGSRSQSGGVSQTNARIAITHRS